MHTNFDAILFIFKASVWIRNSQNIYAPYNSKTHLLAVFSLSGKNLALVHLSFLLASVEFALNEWRMAFHRIWISSNIVQIWKTKRNVNGKKPIVMCAMLLLAFEIFGLITRCCKHTFRSVSICQCKIYKARVIDCSLIAGMLKAVFLHYQYNLNLYKSWSVFQ